ncbi:peptidyl-prolyl cis-trans isomerase C [Stella humosa]|uniref:Parvulin-like PPIase n=1 Tax=Stella humosa TaxID=94 RepID=A0A3N1LPN2_9PROT|nr:peptidylprolyl isomerase [Stella humosa]ROP91165.1 peptidyl-prolyl cis-trans isomerase C [Stella humosa]BBK34483.1 peptidylprolyl isomerase [Stella humosa]
MSRSAFVAFAALAAPLLLAHPAAAQAPAGQPTAPTAADPAAGADPVVARVNGKPILRSDVLAAHRQLPAQVQQMPLDMIFPLVVDQVVSSRLLSDAGRSQNLQNDPDVKNQMARLEERVIERVYLTRVVEKAVTEEKLKAKYAEFVKTQPVGEEVKASHILLEKEDDAKRLTAELEKGGDFARAAREKSIDPSGRENGGDLGFFQKEQMVPEFSAAAFAMKKGETTKMPVKSQFGWHIIRVTDRRQMAAPTFEAAREELSSELTREAVDAHVKGLREGAKVELFNADGTPLAPTPAPGLTPAR